MKRGATGKCRCTDVFDRVRQNYLFKCGAVFKSAVFNARNCAAEVNAAYFLVSRKDSLADRHDLIAVDPRRDLKR